MRKRTIYVYISGVASNAEINSKVNSVNGVLGNHYRLVQNNTFPEPWVEDRNDSGQIQLNNFPNSRDSVSGSDYDH